METVYPIFPTIGNVSSVHNEQEQIIPRQSRGTRRGGFPPHQTGRADFRPQLIIHSAAERRPDICENDHKATDALNVSSVNYLAEAAQKTGATLLVISTDYVFDGTTPPYEVDAAANPLNYYGRSKLVGETAAIESGADHCILRVPVLYGPVENLEESAVTAIARLLENNEEQSVDHWAIRYPTHVDDVATAVRGWRKKTRN